MNEKLTSEPEVTDEDIWLGYYVELEELERLHADSWPPSPVSHTTWAGQGLCERKYGPLGGVEILSAYPQACVSIAKPEVVSFRDLKREEK